MRTQIMLGIVLVASLGLGIIGYRTLNPIQSELPNIVGETTDKGEEISETGGDSPLMTIEGIITDSDGAPVSGATVTLGKINITGSDGKYSFTLEPGTYTLTVTKNGYNSVTSTISATSEQDHTVNLTLNVIIVEPGEVEIFIITRHGSDILFQARAEFLETDIAAEYGITERAQIKFVGVSSSLFVDTITRIGDIDIAWGGEPDLFDDILEVGLIAPLDDERMNEILETIPENIEDLEMKRIIDGDIYWVRSETGPIALLTTAGDAKAALEFIKWVLDSYR